MTTIQFPKNTLEILEKARSIVHTFIEIGSPEILQDYAQQNLRPKIEDYGQVFVPEVVEKAQLGYEKLWETNPYPQVKFYQTQVLIYLANSTLIDFHPDFPGGYNKIKSLLIPERVWLTWNYSKPGEDKDGITYDGLVWIDDHFAWFPKPWKILN